MEMSQSDNANANSGKNPQITVFTPTFNRAYTLERLFESLLEQSFQDFEWLIIDDGSSDNTKELIDGFQKRSTFPIRYFFKENGGIHTAYNTATPLAKGEYLMTIGSDDEMLPDCLSKAIEHWQSMSIEVKQKTFAVCGLCQNQYGTLIGTVFPKSGMRSNGLALRFKHRVKGDKSSLVRTQILRDNPFPVSNNRMSLFEDVIWYKIAKEYEEVYVNELFQVKHLDTNSITRGNLPNKYAYPAMIAERTFLNNSLDYFWYSPMAHLRKAANYRRACMHVGLTSRDALKEVATPFGKLLALLGGLPAKIKFAKDLKVIKRATISTGEGS